MENPNPIEFFRDAAGFAHILQFSGRIEVPNKCLDYLDYLAESGAAGQLQEAGDEEENQGAISTRARGHRRWRTGTKSSQQDKSTSQKPQTQAQAVQTEPATTVSTATSMPSIDQVLRDRAVIEEATNALLAAVRKNDPAGSRAALERGADLEGRDSVHGGTPLHWAAFEGHVWAVDLLLRRAGINVEALNKRDSTPLHCAAFQGHVGTMDMLLRAGANVEVVNKVGDRPLHYAAYYGTDGAVVRLVQAGADLHAIGSNGQTPLQKATSKGKTSTVALLRSLGALR